MKVTISELNSVKRGMEVEIPPEVVATELEKAYENYRRSVRIPGFRKGRIPLAIVKQRYAKQVEGEVLSGLIEEYAHRALDENRIHPIHRPVLDEYDYRQGESLVFRTTFEVRPALEIRDYRGIPVTRREPKITEEMVEENLEALRQRAAKYATQPDHAAQDGDVVVGTLSGRFIEGKGKDFSGEAISMRVGSEENHPDFNAALGGVGAGETRTFQVRYPEDYPSGVLAGRLVEYTLNAREIKVREIPPMDDDLAKEVGEFQSLADLREHLRRELERRGKAASDGEAKDRILTQLVEKHEFEVPEALVEAQLDRQVEDAVRDLLMKGIDPQHAEVNWKEEREKGRPMAVKRVRAMLILEAIASQESLTVTADDLNERLRHEAGRQNVSVADLKEQLARKGQLEGLERQLQREKALDFLLDHATISREG
jgi:trigger factor